EGAAEGASADGGPVEVTGDGRAAVGDRHVVPHAVVNGTGAGDGDVVVVADDGEGVAVDRDREGLGVGGVAPATQVLEPAGRLDPGLEAAGGVAGGQPGGGRGDVGVVAVVGAGADEVGGSVGVVGQRAGLAQLERATAVGGQRRVTQVARGVRGD